MMMTISLTIESIYFSRGITYGHKLNFSTGRSGMVLSVVIESGNPADSDQFIPMVDRHIENYGKASYSG